MANIYPDAVKQMSRLKELNMNLKGHAMHYVITDEGIVMMSSDVENVEKIAIHHNPDKIDCFTNMIFDNTKVTSFCAKATKTNTHVYEKDSVFYMEDVKKDVLLEGYRIDIIENDIMHKFYKRLFVDDRFSNLFHELDQYQFTPLDDQMIAMLEDKETVEIHEESGYNMCISKALFGKIAKSNVISYHVLEDIQDAEYLEKYYVLFKQENSDCDIYTLAAFANY